jgi:high-affinity Fe2+/Pb2+ permease
MSILNPYNNHYWAPSLLIMIAFMLSVWVFATKKWKWIKSDHYKKNDFCETGLMKSNANSNSAAKYRTLTPTMVQDKVRFHAR